MKARNEFSQILKSLAPALVLVALMWIIYGIEKYTQLSFANYGIYPGSVLGLRGILFSVFIHGDLSHLANNTLPLAVLVGYLFTFYREIAWRVILFSIVFSGFWVWISARPSYHIGASGLIYSLTTFLFCSGLLRRNITLMAVSLTIAFLYGSMVWGIFPLEEKVSWESHLWGAISGVVLAVYFKNIGTQRIPFPWEFLSEEEYLKENVETYGPVYWDPVLKARLEQQMREQSDNTFHQDFTIRYDYKEKGPSEG